MHVHRHVTAQFSILRVVHSVSYSCATAGLTGSGTHRQEQGFGVVGQAFQPAIPEMSIMADWKACPAGPKYATVFTSSNTKEQVLENGLQHPPRLASSHVHQTERCPLRIVIR
jgi:hypothetical protein